jgi:hypothetical protein
MSVFFCFSEGIEMKKGGAQAPPFIAESNDYLKMMFISTRLFF